MSQFSFQDKVLVNIFGDLWIEGRVTGTTSYDRQPDDSFSALASTQNGQHHFTEGEIPMVLKGDVVPAHGTTKHSSFYDEVERGAKAELILKLYDEGHITHETALRTGLVTAEELLQR